MYLGQRVERIQNVSLDLHFILHQFTGQPALGLAAHIHHLAVHTHTNISERKSMWLCSFKRKHTNAFLIGPFAMFVANGF